MKVAVVTPHHDSKRSMFLERLKFYMSRQTRQPDMWFIIDEPTPFKPDLTYRVRIGIERAINAGADVILIMEDDDWYDPNYIMFMVDGWKRSGKPPIFGIGYTLYVHIFAGKYWFSPHKNRASLMSTLVTPQAIESFTYPDDTHVWLDIDLWKIAGGKTVEPDKYYSVGIKHNIGLCGGVGHNKSFSKYVSDPNYNELRKHIKDDLVWYRNLKA
jgi:hypothetical protein